MRKQDKGRTLFCSHAEWLTISRDILIRDGSSIRHGFLDLFCTSLVTETRAGFELVDPARPSPFQPRCRATTERTYETDALVPGPLYALGSVCC
jgi:hypothetical protein